MVRHSQLQRQVLSLYKQCLRAAQRKPEGDAFVDLVRQEFRRNALEESAALFHQTTD